jgi:myo-inositol-1(or 4)-monophosphatase
MDLELIQRTALAAAYDSGKTLRYYLGKPIQIDKKGNIDLFTQAYLDAEQAIIRTLRKKFPDHDFIYKETDHTSNKKAVQWIIDPLDGITNYVHGINLFTISIAFSVYSEIKIGVVFNPFSTELFTAKKGHGAYLNGQPIQVTSTKSIAKSFLATGFPNNSKASLKPMIQRFQQCLSACQGIRQLGSAALDLCYVACGRFDGFWEQNLSPWDTAAGSLIAHEAGAKITNLSNQHYNTDEKEILASNGHIHEELISLLRVKDG